MTFKIGYVIAATAVISFAPVAASAHDNGYNHRHQSSQQNNQVAGGLIGAIAGGVIGSQVAGNGARTEGSVLGAVIGGVAGAAIAGDNRSRTYGGAHYNSGGHYNTGGGYYNQGGYYNNRAPQYGHTYYRQQPTYSYRQPSYPRYSGHQTYQRPAYNHYSQPRHSGSYYSGRPNVSISIGTGNYGYRGGNSYRSSRPHYRRSNYRRYRGH